MKLVLKKKKKSLPVKKENEEKNKYTDLRQVMDYKRDLSIFFSGVENKTYLEGCYDMGVRNFLMSYHYIKGRSLKQVLDGKEGIKLFIDSGAYTYTMDSDFKDKSIEEWEEHIVKYLKWAEKNRDYIFTIAGLDIEFLVGCEKVQEFNRKYFEPFMLRTGIPVCFVWHAEFKDEVSWDFYCKRYPYVGLTAVNTQGADQGGLDYFKDKMRVAEKYNTLVHGMGMTRTSMLPYLPFYSVDSTSWKVGMRYGLTSVWDGKKVRQYKKDEFDSKAVPVINSYKDIELDIEQLRKFYEPEVIRANVYAYLKAEDFIVDRLKPLTYWKKARAVKNDLDNLPEDFFPSPDWMKNKDDKAIEYAGKFNINPELPNLYDVLDDCTILMNWENKEYEEFIHVYTDDDNKVLREIHDLYVNKIRETDEERVSDLKKFFSDNISGESDVLLQMGTNFDRKVKEREEYLEDDDEYELVDISKEETKMRLSHFLPTPADVEGEGAPEIDSLDEEIYRKAEVVPVFDSKGHFVKGQKKVLKPKQVYSNKFPKLACDNCFAAAKCPEFKSGYVCAYNKLFKKFDTRNMKDVITAVQGIVGYNMERMQKAMILETLNGNIDGGVSALMDTNIKYCMMLKSMYENGSKEVIKQTKVVREDGSMESTTHISNPQSGGILERLFGNMTEEQGKNMKNVTDNTVDSK